MTEEQLAEWIYNGSKGVFGCSAAARFEDGHAGLWFERFGTVAAELRKTRGSTRYELGASNLAWVQDTITKYSNVMASRAPALREYHERISRLVQLMGGRSFDAGLSHEWTRFVTGMGLANPTGNGFTWHRTLGVPYIPGSSVKGMALAWARDWSEPPDKEKFTRIFGPENSPTQEHDGEDGERGNMAMGSVIFLDALPVNPPEIAAEIMTPHGKGTGAPEDAGKPNPIGFLAVKSCVFRFQVLPSTTYQRFAMSAAYTMVEATEASEKDVEDAIDWIDNALRTIGAGAKTKTGYGRFTRYP